MKKFATHPHHHFASSTRIGIEKDGLAPAWAVYLPPGLYGTHETRCRVALGLTSATQSRTVHRSWCDPLAISIDEPRRRWRDISNGILVDNPLAVHYLGPCRGSCLPAEVEHEGRLWCLGPVCLP